MKSFSIAAIMALTAFAGKSYTSTFRGPTLEFTEDPPSGTALSYGKYSWHPDVDAEGNEVIYTDGSMTFWLQEDATFQHLDQAEVWFCLDGTTECIDYQYTKVVTPQVDFDNTVNPNIQFEAESTTITIARAVNEEGAEWKTLVESFGNQQPSTLFKQGNGTSEANKEVTSYQTMS